MTLDPLESDLLWIKIGLSAAVVICIGLGCWRIHHAGYESGLARDAGKVAKADARVRELSAANTNDLVTIKTLRAANADYAKAAQANAAQLAAAAASARAEQQAAAQAKARAIHDLEDAIHANPNARAWAAARVPDAVADQLRQRATAAH